MGPVLDILHKYLPQRLFKNLVNFLPHNRYSTTTSHSRNKTFPHWDRYKKQLQLLNTQFCADELKTLCSNLNQAEVNVQTFHIDQNHKSGYITEPNVLNTKNMIHRFLHYIYQRNVLASLVKYILLKSVLTSWESLNCTVTKKSTFYCVYQRLNEIVFESVLASFNGGNYDNYLLCNDLITIMSEMRQKLKIFKKGATISTIIINCNYCLLPNTNPKARKQLGQWTMNLYIKDIRNLLSPTISLDRVGKLFNLKVSKLCFPYEQATSIDRLKELTSLDPTNDVFWTDIFSNKLVPLESRLEAQRLFEELQFENLYDYNTYYLIQDCLLLHAILTTMFNVYLSDNINIFLRRVYSQSSLAYQQFYIINPASQIKKIHAPKQINHPFYNYFIKQAVAGGLCTSFVHGPVGKHQNCPINQHLEYLDQPQLSSTTWPNFNNFADWKNEFNNQACGISTIDIRSLYPSASVKKIPVGTPLFFTRVPLVHQEKFETLIQENHSYLDLKHLCQTIRDRKESAPDFFYCVNHFPYGKAESCALIYYLNQRLPHNSVLKILRFQTQFTAMDQFYFGPYPVDGFLTYEDINHNIHMKVIQYNSVYCHGHKDSCQYYNFHVPKIDKKTSTQEVKQSILNIWNVVSHILNLTHIHFEYVDIWDCDFPNHHVPKDNSILHMNKKYSYNSFLSAILSKSVSGFLVVKNLEIKKENQSPLFGFIIQKALYDYNRLSPYTQQQLQKYTERRRVISMHKCKSFMIINTEYFVWLFKTFGFENPPEIYHALCFQLDDYLRNSVETKLAERSHLKYLISIEKNLDVKQILEVKAELIKLMLNSSYGYTLCNLSSTKFKQFINKWTPAKLSDYKKFKSGVKLADQTYLFERNIRSKFFFQTMLGHVGSYILFQSKIILLKRLYFLLKYLNPSKAQLLYMDTDSAHFLLQHPQFVDNVDCNLKNEFQHNFDKHFETGSKLSGIWVHENFYENAEYFSEKCYYLFNNSNDKYLTHMKGLNAHFQKHFVEHNICPKSTPVIKCNLFFKSPDFTIFKTNMSKNVFSNCVPVKRYFVCNTGSLPLKL